MDKPCSKDPPSPDSHERQNVAGVVSCRVWLSAKEGQLRGPNGTLLRGLKTEEFFFLNNQNYLALYQKVKFLEPSDITVRVQGSMCKFPHQTSQCAYVVV